MTWLPHYSSNESSILAFYWQSLKWITLNSKTCAKLYSIVQNFWTTLEKNCSQQLNLWLDVPIADASGNLYLIKTVISSEGEDGGFYSAAFCSFTKSPAVWIIESSREWVEEFLELNTRSDIEWIAKVLSFRLLWKTDQMTVLKIPRQLIAFQDVEFPIGVPQMVKCFIRDMLGKKATD